MMFCTLILPNRTHAANLISIIAADTTDRSIGYSVKADFENMKRAAQEISFFTGLTLVEINLEDTEVTPYDLLEKLQQVDIQPDDVVIFFFSGHGFHIESEKDSTPWPSLYFSINAHALDYESVIKLIEDKNPKFMLTIVDICNSLIPDQAAPYNPLKTPTTNLSAYSEDYVLEHNYKKLFIETSGSIKISSASVGEYSKGGSFGGIFTRAFLADLKKATTSTNGIDWEVILEETYVHTSTVSAKSNSSQHPYYEIDIN